MLFTFLLPLSWDMLAYIPVLFLPFIAAVLIAVSIEPLVDFIQKHFRLSRNAAVIISLLVSSVAAVAVLVLILYIIIQETAELYHGFFLDTDAQIAQFNQMLHTVQTKFTNRLPAQLLNTIQESVESNFSVLQDWLGALLNALVKLVLLLPEVVIFFIISVISGYFIARDRYLIRNFCLGLSPREMRVKTRNLLSELFSVLVGFFKAYSILLVITMLLTLGALKIIGVKYAFSIALLVGLLDIIPILGPGVLFLPWGLYYLGSGNTKMGIAILVTYFLLAVTRQFLEPKILGDNIGLHPLATIAALYIGLKLGGVMGMIMGPVLLVLFSALYRTGILKRPHWLE
jgi:sporulation integral membrane protein YtvI